MSDAARATVIWNPSAGRKVGLPTNVSLDEDEIRGLFAAAGVEIQLVPTATEEEAADAVRAHLADGCPIVAAGGDGTVGLVARELLAAADAGTPDVPPLGILPLGSVMNLARSLGIPRELPEAVGVIAAGTVREIDVGEMVGRGVFLEAVAVGLQAELFAEGAAFDEGDPAAPLRALRTALRYRPARLTLELDGGRRVRTRALVTFVANGPFAGLGFAVAPLARIDDGLFDVRVFELSRLELLLHFWSIALGRRKYDPRPSTYRARRVVLRATRRLRLRADGADAGRTPVEIRIRPRSLRVLAPADAHAGG